MSTSPRVPLQQQPGDPAGALSGYGIALLGDPYHGERHPVEPSVSAAAELFARRRPAFIVYPSRRHLAQRTRVVIDFLVEAVQLLEVRLRDGREWGENEATWLV